VFSEGVRGVWLKELWGKTYPGIGLTLKALLLAVSAYFLVVGGVIVSYAFIDPPSSTMMAWRSLQGEQPQRRWVSLDHISRHLQRAVITSEDARFCGHVGVDWREVERAVTVAHAGGRLRGASTIPMQTMKNLFLWPHKSYLRKSLEVPLAMVASTVWSKRRMLEIYLNIAEWGPGIFGAEMAARHYFRKPAARLTAREAALLAAMLPNPRAQKRRQLRPATSRKAAQIKSRMRAAAHWTSCLRS
jgi:monofunctional biosynthetic peptidoglycan transglycosylase